VREVERGKWEVVVVPMVMLGGKFPGVTPELTYDMIADRS
jgi:hypothetical protein